MMGHSMTRILISEGDRSKLIDELVDEKYGPPKIRHTLNLESNSFILPMDIRGERHNASMSKTLMEPWGCRHDTPSPCWRKKPSVPYGSNLAARYCSCERPESVLPADRSTSRKGLNFDSSTAVDPTRKPAARAIPPAGIRYVLNASILKLGCIPLGRGGPATTRPRIILSFSSTYSDMASASSTSMPR